MTRHHTFTKPIFIRATGWPRHSVRMGDFIRYSFECTDGSRHYSYARVMGYATETPNREEHKPRTMLVTLTLGDQWSQAYLRYVHVEDVCEILGAPNAFLRWFLFASPPDLDEALRCQEYGALNDRYISHYLNTDGELDFDRVREEERIK